MKKSIDEELIALGEKIAKNYRLIVAVAAFLYGCFIFVNTQAQHSQAILTIKNQNSQDIAELRASHIKLEETVTQN